MSVKFSSQFDESSMQKSSLNTFIDKKPASTSTKPKTKEDALESLSKIREEKGIATMGHFDPLRKRIRKIKNAADDVINHQFYETTKERDYKES
jgi:hypothetical protein